MMLMNLLNVIQTCFFPVRTPLELWKIAYTGHFPQEVRDVYYTRCLFSTGMICFKDIPKWYNIL